MSKFLNLINENNPVQQTMPLDTNTAETNQKATPDTQAGPTKQSSFLTKVAAAGKGLKDFSQKIEKIGTGKWDLGALMQGIIDKELDKGTAKLGMFGKKGYQKIVLGEDVITSINEYKSSNQEKKEEEVVEGFLYKIDNLIFETTKEEAQRIRDEAEKLGIPLKTAAGKDITPVRLKGRIDREKKRLAAEEKQRNLGLTDEDKAVEKGIDAKDKPDEKKIDTKNKSGDPVRFKPVGDTKSAKERLLPVVSKLLGKENAEQNVMYITKNFNRIITAIQTQYGPESDYAKGKDAKPLDFTYDAKSMGRISKDEQKKIQTESAITIVLHEAKSDELVKRLGRDGSLELLNSFETVYPGKQIKFAKPPVEEKPVEDKPVEDKPVEDEPVEDDKVELNSKTVFTLSSPQNLGEKGKQYTLQPEDQKIVEHLNKNGIKYITYLAAKVNQLGVHDKSDGQIIAYDNNDQAITKLTLKAPYKFDSEIGGYVISASNEEQFGPQYDQGEAIISIDNENVLDIGYSSNPPYIVIKQPQTDLSSVDAKFSKYKLIRRLEETSQIIFDKRNPLPLSAGELAKVRKEVEKKFKIKMPAAAGVDDTREKQKKATARKNIEKAQQAKKQKAKEQAAQEKQYGKQGELDLDVPSRPKPVGVQSSSAKKPEKKQPTVNR